MASILDYSGDPKKKYGAVAKKDTIFISDPKEYKLRNQAFADSSYAFNKLSTTLSPQKQYQDIKNAQVEGAEVPYSKPKDLTDSDKKKLLKSGVGYKGIAPVKVMRYDEKAEERNTQKGLDSSLYIVKDNVIAESPWYQDPTQVPIFQEKPNYIDPFTIASKKIEEMPIDSKSRVLDLPDINFINQQEIAMNQPSQPVVAPQMSKPSGAAIQGQRRPDYGRQIRNAQGEKSTRAKLIDLIYDEQGNVRDKKMYGKYKNEIAKMNADENYLMNLSPLPDGEMKDSDWQGNDQIMKLKPESSSNNNTEEDPIKDFKKLARSRQFSDDKIDQYMDRYFIEKKGTPTTKENTEILNKQLKDYINSPEYAARQANFPEKWRNEIPEHLLKMYQGDVASWKREKRSKLVDEVPFIIDESGKQVGQFGHGQGEPLRIEISRDYPIGTAAHEKAHALTFHDIPLTDEQKAIMKANNGFLPYDKRVQYETDLASDIINDENYFDMTQGKKGASKETMHIGLNMSEQDKFIKLAKQLSLSDFDDEKLLKVYRKEPHYDKTSKDKARFAGEQYGDLYGVRKLLLDAGITKSFGEALDEDKLNKAIANPKVTEDPMFRRFYNRYGAENLIELNNTIAQQSKPGKKGKTLMDIASA